MAQPLPQHLLEEYDIVEVAAAWEEAEARAAQAEAELARLREEFERLQLKTQSSKG